MKKIIFIISIIILSLGIMSCKKNKSEDPQPTKTVKTYDMSQYKSFRYSVNGYQYIFIKNDDFIKASIGDPIIVLLSNDPTSGYVEYKTYCTENNFTWIDKWIATTTFTLSFSEDYHLILKYYKPK